MSYGTNVPSAGWVDFTALHRVVRDLCTDSYQKGQMAGAPDLTALLREVRPYVQHADIVNDVEAAHQASILRQIDALIGIPGYASTPEVVPMA